MNEIYSAAASGDTIDLEGFLTVYKDIDNLFEEDEDGESEDSAEEVEGGDSDLKESFEQLAKDGAVSKSALRQWEEITTLIDEEGMLGADEFEELWTNAVSGAASASKKEVFSPMMKKSSFALRPSPEQRQPSQTNVWQSRSPAGFAEPDICVCVSMCSSGAAARISAI